MKGELYRIDTHQGCDLVLGIFGMELLGIFFSEDMEYVGFREKPNPIVKQPFYGSKGNIIVID